MMAQIIRIKDFGLAKIIEEELLRNNNRKIHQPGIFTTEELESITKLQIKDNQVKNISELINCSNLKQLEICSTNAKSIKNVSNSFSYEKLQVQIKDFSVINKLKKLEDLTIKNVNTIEELNLTDMPNLSSLELINNENLKIINGLNELDLYDLTLLRTPIKSPLNLLKLINKGLSQVNLDIDLYPNLIQTNPNFFQDYQKLMRPILEFKENYSDFDVNSITYYQMNEMHKKAMEIIKKIIKEDYTIVEKIAAIYYYMVVNVKYDRQRRMELDNKVDRPFRISGEPEKEYYKKINSSYNAIMEGTSVCEGYTNMMHYLLNVVGIESKTVACKFGKDDTNFVGYNSNHSIIRVNVDGNWYYFDPTNDGMKNQFRRFFKTKEEISEEFQLSMDEMLIPNVDNKLYTNEELSKIINYSVGFSDDRYIKSTNSSKSLHDMTIEERVNYAKSVISNYSVDSPEYSYYNAIINQNSKRKSNDEPVIEDVEDKFSKLANTYKKEKSSEEKWKEYIKSNDPNKEIPKRTSKELLISIKEKIRNRKQLDEEEKELYETLNQINQKDTPNFYVEKFAGVDPNELEWYFKEMQNIEMSGDLNSRRIR